MEQRHFFSDSATKGIAADFDSLLTDERQTVRKKKEDRFIFPWSLDGAMPQNSSRCYEIALLERQAAELVKKLEYIRKQIDYLKRDEEII